LDAKIAGLLQQVDVFRARLDACTEIFSEFEAKIRIIV